MAGKSSGYHAPVWLSVDDFLFAGLRKGNKEGLRISNAFLLRESDFSDRSLEACSSAAKVKRIQDAYLFPELMHERSKLKRFVLQISAELE